MSTQPQQPLAWSQTGDAIELPSNAALWRVRRLNSGAKGGAPELVYGPDGLPLTVDIGTAPEEFAEAVDRRPGKYRLDAIDDAKKLIPDLPPAYVLVPGSPARTAAEAGVGQADLSRAFEVIERVTRTLSDAMDKQSAQMATLVDASARLVAAADSAGITRREPPVQETVLLPAAQAPAPAPAPAVEPDSEESKDRLDRILELAMPFIGPMLPQLGALLMSKLAPSTVAPAAAARPAPAPAPPPPAAEPAAAPSGGAAS